MTSHIFEGCSLSLLRNSGQEFAVLDRDERKIQVFSTCEVKRITLVIDYKHLGLLQGISSSLQLKEHQKVL